MRRPWTWWLAWGLWALFVVLTVSTVLLDAFTTGPLEGEEPLAGDIGIALAFATFATVGALVASRRPRNAVGWLFLASPLFALTAAFSEEYAYRALVVEPGGSPGGLAVAWLYRWTWFPAIGAIGLVSLLYPDGRLPGRRWRPVLWIYATLVALGSLGASVYPGPIDDTWAGSHDNPLGIEGLKGFLDTAAPVVGLLAGPLLAAVLASVVVRFRRSRGEERLQLKCMLVGVAIVAAQIVLSEALVRLDLALPSYVSDQFFALAIASIPVAAGFAILRYRLYDVDVVIRKTLVYGSLTVLLGATYAGIVVGMQALLRPLTGGSDLAIAVSTLLVAALFLPVRSRVQSFVDRRFYRRRYDAQRTLEAFGARLREQVELETLGAELRGVVEETMQPSHVSLSLRAGASR